MTNNNKLNLKAKLIKKVNNFKSQFATPSGRKVFKEKVLSFIVNIFKYVLVIGLCFIIIYPLLLQLAVAFRAPTDVNNTEVLWIPGEFSLKNFEVSMIALNYWTALKNTLMISVGVTILQLFATSLAGYAFARLKFRFRGLLFAFAIFTIIVPQTVISLPLLRNLTAMKLIGKSFSLFLMAVSVSFIFLSICSCFL